MVQNTFTATYQAEVLGEIGVCDNRAGISHHALCEIRMKLSLD